MTQLNVTKSINRDFTKPTHRGTNKAKRGITKAQGYVCGIHCAEYDLEEMIIAFGVTAIRQHIEKLYGNMKEGRRYNSRDKDAKRIRDRVNAVMGMDYEGDEEGQLGL